MIFQLPTQIFCISVLPNIFRNENSAISDCKLNGSCVAKFKLWAHSCIFVWGNMMVINNCMQKCSVHEAHGEKIWRNIHFKKLMYRQCRPYFTSIHFNIIQTINIPTEILNLWKEIFLSLFLWKETPKLFVKGVYQLLSVANSLSAAEPTDFLCCNTANYNQLLNMVSIQQSTLACAKLCQSEYSV